MNKNTDLLDTNDTLEIGTDDKLDKVTGSDCGGNSYCDKGRLQKKEGVDHLQISQLCILQYLKHNREQIQNIKSLKTYIGFSSIKQVFRS